MRYCTLPISFTIIYKIQREYIFIKTDFGFYTFLGTMGTLPKKEDENGKERGRVETTMSEEELYQGCMEVARK